jgi:peptidoglycan/LPS O-acetylase OafA/YrhL
MRPFGAVEKTVAEGAHWGGAIKAVVSRVPMKNMQRIPALDGLRGLAVLLVLLWHAIGRQMDLTQEWSVAVLKALNLFWSGVDLFFVLSGFLIGGIMLDHGKATNFIRVFYVRRTLRIVPIYYVVLLSYVLALRWGLPARLPAGDDLFSPGPALWSYFTFTQNFFMAHSGQGGPAWLGPTWSLAVEEQFYFSLPILIFLVPRALLGRVLLGCIAAVPLIRIALYDLPPEPGFAAYLLMPGRADALLLGVLGAWLVRSERAWQWLTTNVRRLYWILLGLCLGVVALHQAYLGSFSFSMTTIGNTWMALFYLCLILVAVIEPHGLVTWVARNGAMRYLGRISYGVYLLHMILIGLAHGLIRGQAPIMRTAADGLVTLLAVLATLALASLSWHFFERPLVDYGHTLKYRHEPDSPVAAA